MKIFVSEKEIPENCAECIYYNNHKCLIDNNGYKWTTQAPIQKNKLCPIKSLEQHDKELLEEFAEKLIEKFSRKFNIWERGNQKEVFSTKDVANAYLDCEEGVKYLLKERGVE